VRDQASINVLLKDGKARRLPRNRAEKLFEQGLAKRYISNTVYKAMKLGITVKDHGTRDMDGALKKQIQAAKAKLGKQKKGKKTIEVVEEASTED
jgi:hypothetical protein